MGQARWDRGGKPEAGRPFAPPPNLGRIGATQAAAPQERTSSVNLGRGIMMLIAAALAFWKGFQIHRGEMAVMAYGLGALALVLGVWHLTRRTPQRRL